MAGDARARIIDEITAAFAGVRLGDGIGLFEAQGLDDYATEEERKALREGDEKDDWTVLASQVLNQANSSLSFFDAKGMRFHLPAYMIAELRGDYRFSLAFTLCHDPRAEQFALLSGPQRVAVRHYIEFLLTDPDEEFDHEDIARALAGYWPA